MTLVDNSQTLTSVFLAQHVHVSEELSSASATLESALQELVATARAAWPDVDLSAVEFVKHLASRTQDLSPVPQALSELHVNDLFLACACTRGLPKALAAFDKHYLVHVRPWVSRIDSSKSFADDVCQTIREKLFIPRHSGAAKISEYSGRGQLLSWLRVAAMRTAIDLARKVRPFHTSSEDQFGDQILKTDSSPEATYIKTHYQDLLREAFRLALSCLSDEEHNLIRLYYEEGLSMEQLGALFSVNRSTIKRRLDDSYSRLLVNIKRYLHQRLQVSSAQLRSLVTLLISRFDLSTK